MKDSRHFNVTRIAFSNTTTLLRSPIFTNRTTTIKLFFCSIFTPYSGSGAVMCYDSCVDFGAIINFICLLNFLTYFFLPVLLPSTVIFSLYFLPYLFTSLLIYSLTPSRIDPFRFQAGQTCGWQVKLCDPSLTRAILSALERRIL